MSYNKLKIIATAIIAACFTIIMVNCTSDNSEELFPTNDVEARAVYNTSLKSIIEEKCISCHVFHLEGSNRYDTYEKTVSSIGQMLDRINTEQRTKMPPADSAQLTEEEINAFTEFLEVLNSSGGTEVSEETPVPFKLMWTAYKYPNFDDRGAVSGTFDDITYELNTTYENPEDILDGATITIDTKSVNVGDNPKRTGNVGVFFSFFTPTIEGRIVNYSNEEATIAFRMNDITRRVRLEVEITPEMLILKGSIPDLSRFNWQEGHDELEKICGIYHDNKLWPDVDIVAEILLNK